MHEAVLRAFSDFRAGQPSPTVAGLVVVPLLSAGGREAPMLLQAWLGSARDAATARTALWSGPEPALGGAPTDEWADGVVAGWTLWAGDEMLAGWLGLRGRAARQEGGREAARATETAH